MTTWYRYAGDTNDTVVVKLHGVADLSTATSLSATVTPADGSAAGTPLTATITDSAAATVTVALGTWLSSSATPGRYKLRTHVTFGGTSDITWPSRGDDYIVVDG